VILALGRLSLTAILSGIIEMDETYIGGKEKNKHQHKKTQGTQGRFFGWKPF
jgi:hypothetical protein